MTTDSALLTDLLQESLTPSLASTHNSFNAILEVQELSDGEYKDVCAIFRASRDSLDIELGEEKDQEHPEDMTALATVTKELKAINRQNIVLLGERISKAREILRYSEKGFKQWLHLVFGSHSTGYNYLNYFELHNSLPKEHLKNKLEEMPAKAAYVLASKDASIDQKVDIIETHYTEQAKNIISHVKATLSSDEDKNLINPIDKLLDTLEKTVTKLFKMKEAFDDDQKQKILHILNNAENNFNYLDDIQSN
ncbi:MAG: CT583 family protein [Chlamydiota bacterium]